MGDRYIIPEVICPRCGAPNTDVYYAPTCGFVTFKCKCEYEIDLEQYTGTSYEEASNADVIAGITSASPVKPNKTKP